MVYVFYYLFVLLEVVLDECDVDVVMEIVKVVVMVGLCSIMGFILFYFVVNFKIEEISFFKEYFYFLSFCVCEFLMDSGVNQSVVDGDGNIVFYILFIKGYVERDVFLCFLNVGVYMDVCNLLGKIIFDLVRCEKVWCVIQVVDYVFGFQCFVV